MRSKLDGTEQAAPSDESFTSSVPITDGCIQKERFDAAFKYMHANRRLVRLLAFVGQHFDVQLLVLGLIHVSASLVIFGHFAQIKFNQQDQDLPLDTHYRSWKVWAPTLEFGTMHVILFQLALLPLTMCRVSLTYLASQCPWIHRFLPINRMTRIHVYLGYLVAILVALATVFFFVFFGVMCGVAEEETFCDKFSSEIMGTGYAIIALLLLVGFTSYFRYSLPYEVFYVAHHLVFVMYAVTIAHTLDGKQRSGNQSRSQTFRWFSASLLYYVCDRLAMRLHHKYYTRIVSMSKVAIDDATSKTSNLFTRQIIFVKVQRPNLFLFQPGHHAFLKIGSLGFSWHPFSIASDPSSPTLDFYIETHKEMSWSDQLAKLLDGNSPEDLKVELTGPFGSPIVHGGYGRLGNPSSILAIGGGTGVVPLLSLYKQFCSHGLKLNPAAFVQEMEQYQEKNHAQVDDKGKRESPLVERVSRHLCDKKSTQDSSASDDIVGRRKPHAVCSVRTLLRKWIMILGTSVATSLGFAAITLTISSNSLPFERPARMTTTIYSIVGVFQLMYAGSALFIWPSNTLWTLLDVGALFLTALADWYLFRQYEEERRLHPKQVVFFIVLCFYATARCWCHISRLIDQGGNSSISWQAKESYNMGRLQVVWVTKSTAFVELLLSDLQSFWDSLGHNVSTLDMVSTECRLSVHCTGSQSFTGAADAVNSQCNGWTFLVDEQVHFSRPDLEQILVDFSKSHVGDLSTCPALVAFFGSPDFANSVHREKTKADLLLSIAGYEKQVVGFHSESYGR